MTCPVEVEILRKALHGAHEHTFLSVKSAERMTKAPLRDEFLHTVAVEHGPSTRNTINTYQRYSAHIIQHVRLGAAGAPDVRRHDLAHLLGQCIEKWYQALHVCSREGRVHELAVFAVYIIYTALSHMYEPIGYGHILLIGAPSSPRPKTRLSVLHNLH